MTRHQSRAMADAGAANRARAMLSVLEDLQREREHLAREISERRRAEKRFQAAVESAPIAMVMINASGEITLINAVAEELFGYSRQELVGQTVEILAPERFRADHPQHRAKYFAAPAARKMGAGRELYALRKDGSEFPVEIGLNPVETDDGIFALSTIVDVTERKRLEESQRALNEELERRVQERTAQLAQSNEALEQSNVELQQFAYVASHDLQTPLRAIAGFAQFLKEDYQGKLDERADDYIRRIVDACQRMQGLINDLLAYSRVDARSTPFRPVDLNDVYDDALVMLEASIEEVHAKITRDQLPMVRGDRAQLSQVLQNLIGNGVKYHGEATPEVHVSAQAHNGGWRISVVDNGIGIDPQYHALVFEIFRRLHTQNEYPGTGIGLAVCRRIVVRHGGQIWVESGEGRGSTFHFTLSD